MSPHVADCADKTVESYVTLKNEDRTPVGTVPEIERTMPDDPGEYV
jgi:hypothetical protein